MGTIDFPLTDGVHEESDNKLGKPSGLVECDNFYYELLGRLAQRGGFRGNATTDTLALTTTGAPRHAVEADVGLVVGCDSGLNVAIETNADELFQLDDGWYQESSEPMGLQSLYSAYAGAGVTIGSHTNADIIYAAPLWYTSVGGIVYYSADRVKWAIAYNGGWASTARPWCTMAAMTTTFGPGVLVYQGDGVAVNKVAILYGNTVLDSYSFGAVGILCGCVFSIGTQAVAVLADATNIYVLAAKAGLVALKVTWAHGETPVRLQANGSGTSMYISLQTGFINSTTGKYYTWVVPADPYASAWAGAPGVTNAWPSAAGTTYSYVHSFDVTSNGYAIVSDSESNTRRRLRKYKFSDNSHPTFLLQSVGIAGPAGGNVYVVSRVFAIPGWSGFWFFGVADYWPDPGNALLLMRIDPNGTLSTYDGEVAAVSDVQQTPMLDGLFDPSQTVRFCQPTPFVESDGSISFVSAKVAANGTYQMFVSRYRWCGGEGGKRRSVASLGSLVVTSGGCKELQDGLYSPGWTLCGASLVAGSGVAPHLAVGTYGVRMLLEFDLPGGRWQGPATLPRLVAVNGAQSLDVSAACIWYPMQASVAAARLVVFVAPPGSAVYYRSGSIEAYTDRNARFAALTLGLIVHAVDLTGEILYESSEPPRVYPGSASGVASAHGRLWRYSGTRLWHTHSTTANQATQWAGDDFRLDFASEIQGVGQLQGQPVVITARSVYLLEGDGPDRTGNGSYSVRTVASLPLGCRDQRSVLETPAGLMWASVRGIELLPPGGGVPQSVGQPVRQTYALGDYVLGAHSQARSLAVWFLDGAAAVGADDGDPFAICFDYLRNVWFTWSNLAGISPVTAAFSWSESLGFFETDSVSTNLAYAAFDAKLIGGAIASYPQYSLDSAHGIAAVFMSSAIDTGDIRVSGTNANATWRNVWMLGARTQTSGVTYSIVQTADGVVQAIQSLPSTGTPTERQWMRAQIAPPVSDCDGSGFRVGVITNTEFGPAVAQTPSITSLSIDYDITGNQSRLGAGNRG